MTVTTIKDFYGEMLGDKVCPEIEYFLSNESNADIGHFNVFDIAKVYQHCPDKRTMPYNRRTYYKISLIKGKNLAEYADRVVEIKDYAVLFATPKIPYRYTPLEEEQSGHFCVFTKDFMAKSKSGLLIDDMAIFKPNGDFIFQISASQFSQMEEVFKKMHEEIASDYVYKYDLLRNFVIELLHYGQKLQPVTTTENLVNASSRISSLFIELLERQFPIESPSDVLRLRTAKEYAEALQVHVNHLNKVLKEVTGKTTTEIIAGRITQEAKVLLRQTSWNVSEIAYSLGFEEVAHFSNFFKKQSQVSPLAFRH